MNCPYCNSDETYKVLFGEIDEETQYAIDSGMSFCIHVSQIGKPVQVQENLFYCEDCKKTFVPNPEDEIYVPNEQELMTFYALMRLKYKPEKIKYLILSDMPCDISIGTAPSFFYANPDNDFYNNLYEEVITTLFFPPEFVDKTRTVGLSIEKGFKYMDKYLTMFKNRGFFQMDAVELPPNFYVDYDRSKTVIRTMIKDEIEEWKEYTLEHIYQVADKDTRIILVKKDVYDIYYPELSKKYKILNDSLIEKYEKPYISSANGHQREFRQKFYHCLKSDNYEFEKDFSYITYKDY